MEGSVLKTDIVEQGYSILSNRLSTDAIGAVVNSYINFTDNHPDPSLSTLNAMMIDIENLDILDYSKNKESGWNKYMTNHTQYAKPGGYTNRSRQVEALRMYGRDVLPNTGEVILDDPKEYYHYHPDGLAKMKLLHKEHGWGGLPPELYKLHLAFEPVYYMTQLVMKEALSLLEDDHPELMSRFARQVDLDSSPLRLVFYHMGQGDVLASKHTDKSLATYQAAESHPGLRAEDPTTKEMKLIQKPDGTGVFFPGTLWNKKDVYPNSKLRETYHDVIQIDTSSDKNLSIYGNNCTRWALIAFLNSTCVELPTKAMTHIYPESYDTYSVPPYLQSEIEDLIISGQPDQADTLRRDVQRRGELAIKQWEFLKGQVEAARTSRH